MFCVCYRPHGALNCEAKIYGPFDYEQAESVLVHLGALGIYNEELHEGQCGHKYIAELLPAPL